MAGGPCPIADRAAAGGQGIGSAPLRRTPGPSLGTAAVRGVFRPWGRWLNWPEAQAFPRVTFGGKASPSANGALFGTRIGTRRKMTRRYGAAQRRTDARYNPNNPALEGITRRWTQ
jgi:hypothetical protein